jgi:hypothetical protein
MTVLVAANVFELCVRRGIPCSVAPGLPPMVLLMYKFYSSGHLRSVKLTTEDEKSYWC